MPSRRKGSSDAMQPIVTHVHACIMCSDFFAGALITHRHPQRRGERIQHNIGCPTDRCCALLVAAKRALENTPWMDKHWLRTCFHHQVPTLKIYWGLWACHVMSWRPTWEFLGQWKATNRLGRVLLTAVKCINYREVSWEKAAQIPVKTIISKWESGWTRYVL